MVRKKKSSKSRLRITGNGKIGAARKRKNRNVVIGLFVGIGILAVVLIGLIISSFGLFEGSSEPEMFSIKDECSLMMGNLIHQIRDEGECRIKCVNECDVREMNFVRFEFEGKNNDCSSCDCWCD
jgi:hypothetical protein